MAMSASAGVPMPSVERPAALTTRLADALRAQGPGYVPRTHHLAQGDGVHPLFTNRLILESSPYLLQHAHNPVDWFPWGEEAFAEAKRLGRPVFLSIGYSTCHWCHVMEEESFEDLEIAAYLNRHFIAIKVDREERPDVDAIYMSAVQALTGQGGWPMSVFLTPDREPFYGGTYFPPRDGVRGARIGFLGLLAQLSRTYADDSERVKRATASLVAAVKEQMEGVQARAAAARSLDRTPIDLALRTYQRLFDNQHGGLRRAPKFPSNIPVRLFLRVHARDPEHAEHAELLAMAALTLEKMAGGGMYDQIGGGFHRYSTDAQWLVPHFEKMLYDNALLVPAYAEAFQVTGRPLLARVVRETLDYLLREMAAPEGGFYSATDADSEGEEGKFFVWSLEEVTRLLGPEAERFARHYDITAQGNFEGHNIPHTANPDEAEHAALAHARQILYDVRARRPPPLLDDKIIAAWNGLSISALAIGGRILNEPRYLDAARRAADFLLTQMMNGDRVVRAFRRGVPPRTVGFLEDQAFVTQGLIDLWESTFEPRWLKAALALAEAQEKHFADVTGGGWFMTAADGEALIAREKPQYDGAEPSGTSVAWHNALRLGAFTDDPRWRSIAERAHASLGEVLANNPLALSEGLLALDWMTAVPREIVIVTPAGAAPETARPMLDVLRRIFLPHRVLVLASEDVGLDLWLLRDRPAIGGRPTAYVCVDGQCALPVTTAAELEQPLRPASPAA